MIATLRSAILPLLGVSAADIERTRTLLEHAVAAPSRGAARN
jgi:hypothetical protein